MTRTTSCYLPDIRAARTVSRRPTHGQGWATGGTLAALQVKPPGGRPTSTSKLAGQPHKPGPDGFAYGVGWAEKRWELGTRRWAGSRQAGRRGRALAKLRKETSTGPENDQWSQR